jgi:integrase
MALSDARIRNAKGRAARYRLSDSHGLSIEVTPAGSRLWRYRYRIDGKENLFAAGEWCQAPAGETAAQTEARRDAGRLTLAEARAARVTWRDMVKAGQHPRLVRAAVRLMAAQSSANTFEAVAREYIARRGGNWGDGYRRRFIWFLEANCYPDLGALPIATLGPAHILAVLQKIEARGAYTVARTGRVRLGQIFRYAVATQKAVLDPTSALRGALVNVETTHHASLRRDQIGPFLRAIGAARANRQTEIAVRLLLLTMLRTIELRGGWWTEIDFAHAEWRLPPERMKMRLAHVVPLARQAVELVTELHAMSGRGSRLFPNRNRPRDAMAASTLGQVFVRAGYAGQFSPHGFRGTAATLLREAGFDSRLVELQLAHKDRNTSRAAYDHAELLGPRRAMLQAWADMIDAASMVTPKPIE